MIVHLLYSPFPSLATARAASRELICQRLVACCNLLPAGESHYLWEGQYTTVEEVILIAKTTAGNLEKAKETLALHHPYTTPAILSFAADANSAFAAWVTAASGQANHSLEHD